MIVPPSGHSSARSEGREAEEGEADERHGRHAHRLTRSAGTVSLGVGFSRVLGLVREQILAYLFPAKTGLDAFYAAFRIPNLLRDMFAEGALSKAFVSTFAEIDKKEGREAALRLANVVLNALVLAIGALTLSVPEGGCDRGRGAAGGD
jgi:putative peptidoglycan lipid II flippase